MLINIRKCSYFFFSRASHPHHAIRTVCMPSYVKALECTQAELTLCVSPPQPRMEKSQVHRWCSRGSHSLLQFWASDQSCGGCQASLQPRAVCAYLCVFESVFWLSVCLPVCVYFLCVWHCGYLACPLLTAGRISRQGLHCHWHTTQVHMWSQWNLWQS